MKKYKIEGDIDFYAELYKSLDEKPVTNNDLLEKSTCLISNLPLTDRHVKLNCGHNFNYVPLYNDIVNHKLKFNSLESTNGYLKKNQIRCPYCRKKQDGLLPYYEDIEGVKKIEYVNYVDETKKPDSFKDNYKDGKCLWMVDENHNFNPNEPESESNSKFVSCGGGEITTLYKIIDVSDNEYKYYCYNHKSKQIKQNSILLKEKVKQEKLALKEKAKQEKLALKAKAKEALKNEKLLAKQKLQNNILTINNNNENENVIVGVIDLTTENTNYCVEIIKSGPNKGKQCSLKATTNNLCNRHSNKNVVKTNAVSINS